MFSKGRKLVVALLVLLCVLTLGFIWGNSLRSRSESQEQSRALLRAVEPVVEFITGRELDAEDDLWLRKTAHFLEFGLLGAELSLLMAALRRYGVQSLCNCLFAGLLAAVIDEYIQVFSGRGSQLSDVLLDFSGVAAAAVCVFLVCRALRGARERKRPGG